MNLLVEIIDIYTSLLKVEGKYLFVLQEVVGIRKRGKRQLALNWGMYKVLKLKAEQNPVVKKK